MFTRSRRIRIAILILCTLAVSPAYRAAQPAGEVRAAPLELLANFMRDEPPTWISAYRASEIDRDDGIELVVPRLVHDVAGRRTVVHVVNVDNATANVTFEPRTAAGVAVPCNPAPACVATLGVGGATAFDAEALGLVAGFDGQAHVTTDGWIVAAAIELADDAQADDSLIGLALSRDFPGPLGQFLPALPRGFASGAGTGTAEVVAYNPDTAAQATVDGTFHAGAVAIPSAAIAADALGALNLSGLASGTGALATTANPGPVGLAEATTWTLGGRATVGDARPWQTIQLPLILKQVDGRCSVLNVHETGGFPATIGVEIIARGATGPYPTTSFPIGAHGALRMDVCSDPAFASIPSGFVGALRLTSPGEPIAAAVEIVNASGQAVGLYDGTWIGMPEVVAPIVHSAWRPASSSNVELDSAIAVMNLGAAPVSVRIDYVGVSGTCMGQPYAHPSKTIPVGGMELFEQGANGGSGLPADCAAAARVVPDGPAGGRITAVVLDEAFGCDCERECVAGRQDAFDASNGAETTSPSPELLALYGPSKDFDEVDEGVLSHTFDCPPQIKPTGAWLEVGVRPESGDTWNDAVNVGVVVGGAWTAHASPTLASLAGTGWNAVNFPTGAVFKIDLGAAPFGAATLAAMAGGKLDVMIQDDTTVDYLVLHLCFADGSTRTFQVGTEDQLAAPTDADIPTTSPALDAFLKKTYIPPHSSLPSRVFDQPGANLYLAHTFTGLNVPGFEIVGATLHFGARPEGDLPHNDQVWLGHVGGAGFWSSGIQKWAFGAAWTTGSPYAKKSIVASQGVLSDMRTFDSLDVAIQEDTAVDFLRLEVAYACCRRIEVGDDDAFQAEGPATTPSAPLDFWARNVLNWPNGTQRGFDAQLNDGYFAHSFTGLRRPGFRICSATFTVRLRRLSGMPGNDALTLGTLRPVHPLYNTTQWNAPRIQRAPLWTTMQTSPWTLTQDVTNLGWLMEKDDRLDVLIMDDTAIDWMTLEICYCPVESGGGGNPVSTSGAVVSSQLASWPGSRLDDGDPTTAWSSSQHREHLMGAEWAALTFAGTVALDALVLDPRVDPADESMSLGFPKDLVIQVSDDEDGRTCDPAHPRFAVDANWTPVSTHVGFQQPTSDSERFAFPAVNARCVRVFGAELSQDDYGNRYMQLAGMSAFADGASVRVAEVATSSALPRWPADGLVDADQTTSWSSNQHREHLAGAEWAAVVFEPPMGPRGSTSPLDAVLITPRSDPGSPGGSLGFPKDYVLQYSDDTETTTCDPARPEFGRDSNWTALVTRYGAQQPGSGTIRFDVPSVNARCVRLFGAELSQDDYGNRYLQLAEIAPMAGATSMPVVEVATSSALSSWPAARLADGDLATAWSSSQHREHLAGAEWSALLLDGRQIVDAIQLVPRVDPSDEANSLGFPKDFVLQYSDDTETTTCDPARPEFGNDSNWRAIGTYFGFPQPSSEPVVFSFAPRVAGCVRVLGTELSQDDYGNRYMQLAELEVSAGDWSVPAPTER